MSRRGVVPPPLLRWFQDCGTCFVAHLPSLSVCEDRGPQVRDLRKRKGWADALQNRYRSLGTSAGVVVEQPHAWTWLYFKPQSKFTVVPGRITYAIFNRADVA